MLGRDPVKKPLTELEFELFARALQEHVESEFTPRADKALVTGNPNVPGD